MGKRLSFALAALLVGAFVLALVFLPINRWLLEVVSFIRGAGTLGVVVYAAAYVLATVFFLPGARSRASGLRAKSKGRRALPRSIRPWKTMASKSSSCCAYRRSSRSTYSTMRSG